MAPSRELWPGEVHVLWTETADCEEAERCAEWEALLTDAERERRDRFVVARVRHEYLVTRALARTTLAAYAGLDPRALEFESNAWGRPEIALPEAARALRFNLSNTIGLVAIAVARDIEVGVDVEDTQRRGETVAVAHRFFAESEVRDLGLVPEEGRRARFFDYWTLKEAYIKARGMGLAIPLEQFAFSIDGARVSIAFDPRLDDDPAAWQFAQRSPTSRHRLSLAIRRGAREDLPLTFERVVPPAR
ncbi:MAG TPA: 4'-phosphopantetheinyl transferase superfamily protein [Byssovorax sp.]